MESSTRDQDQAPHFLIGSIDAEKNLDNTCPYAKTLHGYSETLERWCLIQIRCKRWGCRYCGERKVVALGYRCQEAEPKRLITLTVAIKQWETPRDAYDGTKRMVTRLAIKLRRQFKEFEYFKVLEVTKKGWPHYHLIVRSPYIPQALISDEWSKLTGAHIVDVRKIKRPSDVYFYIVKYLSKQKYIPWTDRRVSWSKRFFPKNDFARGPGLKLTDVGWIEVHPREVLRKEYHPFKIHIYSNDCWTLPKGVGFELGRPIRSLRKKKKNA